jgi:hypothetical protein
MRDKNKSALFEGMLPEREFADEIGYSLATVCKWRRLGMGPPVTWIGRFPYYQEASSRKWMLAQERRPGRRTVPQAAE